MIGINDISYELQQLHELFDEEWRGRESVVPEVLKNFSGRMDGTRCTLINSLPELLMLVQQSHHTSMQQHQQAIRRVLMDHDFVAFETGDLEARHDLENNTRINALADDLVEILEKVRQRAIGCGNWSDRLAAEQFFG